ARGLFPQGQTNRAKSFATGKPLTAEAVHAVGGGKLYAFADDAELASFNAALAKLDALPGPHAGSSVLALPFATGDSGAFNWAAVEEFAAAQASAWTETKKKLFLIRVNFSNNTAEPVTQAAAAAEINGASSDMIRAMSYGKTWIEGTVSANVYTMPQTTTFYVNGGSGLNAELLRDARNTFRNTKSGGDAAINIGPVSSTGNGDANGLGDYDIVGVFFGSISMVSGGVTYAGLAGGGNLWVQNANYTSLYVHEWGHNYGLGHASFWQTSDGSVVGTGSSVEYGDPFDVMGGGPAPEGHYHPQGKAKLNWLTASEWADATAAGSNTYRIYREDASATVGTPRGVRVTKAATPGSEQYYWVGYKPAFTSNTYLQRGAYLNWQRPGVTQCWLLDTTPSSANGKNDAAVSLGRTYADTAAQVFITPLAVGGTAAEKYLDVRVNLGPFPGNSAPTAGSISGASTVAARTSTTFTVSANDANTDALSYSWDTQDGAVKDNASSLAHTWTVGGSYPISVTVSDMKGGTITVNKTVTVTDPLSTWTQQSVGTTDNLQEVVYGKGRFVAAEYWGTVFQSWNGTSWTDVGEPPAFDSQPQLAFGNNVFVMAGKIDNASAAQICYSTDGRSWNAATFPAGVPQVRDVTFANGRFLAVGDGGTVLSSTDGVTWTLTSVPAAPDFRLVSWDGSTWISVAYHTGNARAEIVWTSLDGVTWAQHGNLGVGTHQVLGHNGVMYALGWYAGVMYSTDHGLTWQDATMPGTSRWTTNRMAIATDGTFFATGQAMDESGSPVALLVSTDGLSWSRSTDNGGNTAVANANGIVFGFGKFLTVENGGITRSSNSFYPTNAAPVPAFTSNPATGAARQVVAFGATATDANSDTLVYAWDFGTQFPILDGASIAPTFAFGGSYAVTLRVSDERGGLATLNHAVTITDPARTFTQRTSGTMNDLHAIAANTNVAVAVGGSDGDILTSTDGVTWTARTLPDWGGNITFHSATRDGSKFIIVGQDYNFTAPAGWQGVIYTSPNGTTWTRRYGGGTERANDLQAVASDGAGAVAVGSSGTVLTSADGLTWSPVTVSGIAPNLSGAAWNGSVYTIVGYSGGNGTTSVFTSTNRSSWVNRSAGAGVASWQDLRKIAWLNDRFVSSGWYSKLRTSSDNGQTFTTTRTRTEENPAMAFGDGIYFTAGQDRDASSADVDVLSLDGGTWYSFAAPTTSNRNGAVFFKHTFITVGDGGSIWQSGDTTPVATGFAAWQATNFPGGGAASQATSDADNDGLLNLAEYGLNRNPNLGTGGHGSSAAGYVLRLGGRAWLHLDMPEPAQTDVTYTVQGTTTLTSGWTNLAQKTGAAAWTWLGGGTAQISQGSASSGRVPVEIGMPDSAASEP
ncbi:MAG: PKD domain-containing protein, partial [Roseimicrobium sp.]